MRESFRHALNGLATVHREWFCEHANPEWGERYAKRMDLYQVAPAKRAEREALQRAISADGLFLLNIVFSPEAPTWLGELPAIKPLWRVWLQTFTWTEAATLRFRTREEIPPGRLCIGAPCDEDARYSQKRSTSWVGYKVHLTAMCDEDRPMIVTKVETSKATPQDFDVVQDVHDALGERDLLPKEPWVDMGFKHPLARE